MHKNNQEHESFQPAFPATQRRKRTHRSPLRFLRARSLLILVLAGFILVTTPLAAAVIYGAISVDRFASESTEAVRQAVKTTESSRILIEQLVTMERSIRQYRILDDPALLELFDKTHREFTHTITELLSQSEDPQIREKLELLAHNEQAFYNAIFLEQATPATEQDLDSHLEPLNELAQTIWKANSLAVGEIITSLGNTASVTQQTMLWHAATVIPATLVLVLIFTYLIARPIRQLDNAIRRLGNTRFEERIRISGPKDLEHLGEQLDWLRQRLIKLEDDKMRFLRNVSHELKTPLASVREGCELLADEVVGELNTEQRDIIRWLQSGAIQLQHLIENLLNYQCIDAQAVPLHFTVFDLQETVRTASAEHKIVMLAKKLTLDSRLQKVEMLGDENKIKSIINNLLSNAVKYSPQGGVIRVILEPHYHKARLEVHDQGPGISPQEQARIYDTFYRGRSTLSTTQGTGLGLAIVREYALIHNGSVEAIKSVISEHGAGFRVELPLNTPEKTP